MKWFVCISFVHFGKGPLFCIDLVMRFCRFGMCTGV